MKLTASQRYWFDHLKAWEVSGQEMKIYAQARVRVVCVRYTTLRNDW